MNAGISFKREARNGIVVLYGQQFSIETPEPVISVWIHMESGQPVRITDENENPFNYTKIGLKGKSNNGQN
jgi:hypothetical protein